MIKKKHSLSGIFAISSFLVRQNNIVWLIFVFAYGYVSKNGYSLNLKYMLEYLKKAWMFVLGIIAFAIFVYWNGGVAVNDKAHHEAGIYLGNIFFMLFMMFVFFLPYHIMKIPDVIRRIKTKPYVLLIPFSLIMIYIFAEPVMHPYNFTPKFLRNELLLFIQTSAFYEAIYLSCIAFVSLAIFEFGIAGAGLLLFPFAILSVLPSWLIEHRYYFIAITLFMLFRHKMNKKAEYGILVGYVAISLFFFLAVYNQWFML